MEKSRISTFNKDFKVLSGAQDLTSTLNSSISIDTTPSGPIIITQNTVSVNSVTEDEVVDITAKKSQNFYVNASSGGKTIVSE